MKNPFSQELDRIKKSQQLLTIFLLLFVLVFFWTIVSVFSVKKEDKVSSELELLAKPLSPNLNLDVLSEIESKTSYSEVELADFPIYRILISRDGRSKFVVPIEVTLDEVDPEVRQQTQPATEEIPRPTPEPSPIASPSPTPLPDTNQN